jgi:hypothetical protein
MLKFVNMQIRSKFADIYGLEIGHVKMEFDGDKIQDGDTADSLEIEDDNIVDVQVLMKGVNFNPFKKLC